MKLKKISIITISILIINSLSMADKKSEGTDSLVNYIKETFGAAILPADLDTLIQRYEKQRYNDSSKIDYYGIWNVIFQSVADNAKRNHPNAVYINDTIINGIIIRGAAGKKYWRYINDDGLSWMSDFKLKISPILLGRVDKPDSLRNYVWKNCEQTDLANFVFNCKAFGPPDSMPDTLPYNTNIYKAIAGDTAAQQTVFDSISKLNDSKELYNAMELLGYIGNKNAMQKALEYFPDTAYIAEKVFAGKYNPIIIQKTSLRMAIIEALAYNNPDTVPQSFLQNYVGSDNWYQIVTDKTGETYKRDLKAICRLACNHHCFKDGQYYPTQLINDLQKVADWASKRYDCKVKMPTSDYKVIPIICIGGALR